MTIILLSFHNSDDDYDYDKNKKERHAENLSKTKSVSSE